MTLGVLMLAAVPFWWGLGFLSAEAQSPVKDVEAMLDAWRDRASARQALLQIGPEGEAAVRSVALASDEAHLRRSRAISLLATIKTSRSIETLARIADEGQPIYRCLAVQALAEIGTEEALPVLAKKLDDASACMKAVTTDPAGEHDVLVCDEAVRALEHVTGLSFKGKDTKAWKAWWDRRTAGRPRPANK